MSEFLMFRTEEGDLYFYNTLTKTSQWERPAGCILDIAANDKSAWRCYTNEGRDYFVNSITGEKTFLRPKECEFLQPINIPSSWIAFRNSNQEVYFFNTVSKETSWRRPSYILEDLSNVLLKEVSPSSTASHELPPKKKKANFYENLSKSGIELREQEYFELLNTYADLKHFSLFEKWYPIYCDDHRSKNVAPERRCPLFLQYCERKRRLAELELVAEKLDDVEKIKLVRKDLARFNIFFSNLSFSNFAQMYEKIAEIKDERLLLVIACLNKLRPNQKLFSKAIKYFNK